TEEVGHWHADRRISTVAVEDFDALVPQEGSRGVVRIGRADREPDVRHGARALDVGEDDALAGLEELVRALLAARVAAPGRRAGVLEAGGPGRVPRPQVRRRLV